MRLVDARSAPVLGLLRGKGGEKVVGNLWKTVVHTGTRGEPTGPEKRGNSLRDVVARGAVGGRFRRLGFRCLFHGVTEVANSVPQTFAEFRQLLGSKYKQRNRQNHEQM